MPLLYIVLVFLIPGLAAFLVVGLMRLIRRSLSSNTGKKLDYIGFVCLFILFGLFATSFLPHDHSPAKRTVCLSNNNMIAKSLLLYWDEHDKMLPPMNQWCEAVSPYMNYDTAFQCPELQGVPFAYGLNRAARLEAINSDSLVLSFDGPGGKNFSGGKADVRYRHPGDVAVFSFADGHAKSATQDTASGFEWTSR